MKHKFTVVSYKNRNKDINIIDSYDPNKSTSFLHI